MAELPGDAIVSQFTDEILQQRGLSSPVGEIRASSDAGSP